MKRRQNNLWLYLPGRPPKSEGTRTVAKGTNFYDLPEVPADENDLEAMLAEIESGVAPRLASMREGNGSRR